MTPIVEQSPLLDFFYDLQKMGKKSLLGLDSYFLFIEALEKGIGLLNEEELYFLCKTLWLKPNQSEKHFKRLFDKHLSKVRQAILKVKIKQSEDNQSTSIDVVGERNDEYTPPSSTPILESEETEIGPSEPPKPTTKKQKMVTLAFQASNQATKAIPEQTNLDEDELQEKIAAKKYIIDGKYYPIAPRNVIQGIRSLRIQVRQGRKTELDIPNTILKLTQTTEEEDFLVFQPAKSNKTVVTFLIDNSASMIAFKSSIIEMMRLLKADKGIQNLQIYYFSNFVINALFHDEYHLQTYPLQKLVVQDPHFVFVMSDGGAARGGYNGERLNATENFLEKLSKHRLIWLNPTPKARWKGTTADYIDESVKMFEMNDVGFSNGVKYLKQLRK